MHPLDAAKRLWVGTDALAVRLKGKQRMSPTLPAALPTCRVRSNVLDFPNLIFSGANHATEPLLVGSIAKRMLSLRISFNTAHHHCQPIAAVSA